MAIITALQKSDLIAEIPLREATPALAVNKLVDQVGGSSEILRLMASIDSAFLLLNTSRSTILMFYFLMSGPV